MATFDAIVVGSGPNGLSAAIVLAQAGLSVLVREANATLGGGARSAELTLPGFVHDLGSAVHPMATVSPFLRTLPLADHGLEWIDSPLPLVHPLDGRPPTSVHRSLDETAAGLAPDAAAYKRLLAPLVQNWDALLPELLTSPLHVPKHPFAMARFGMRALLPTATLNQLAFRGERAKALLAGLSSHSILAMEEAGSSAIGLVLAALAHTGGWPIPRGGAQNITNALASYLRQLGGVIETNAPVESIDTLPSARAVLFDVSPRQLVKIAGRRLPASYVSSLEEFAYGPGIFKMDWALAEPIPWYHPDCAQAITLHIGGSEFDISASEHAMRHDSVSERPFLIFAQPSLFDSSRAPQGKHTAWAYCHVPNSSTKDMSSQIEAQIERFAPGFRDVVLARATTNTLQLQQSNANLIGGDISGGANHLAQLFARPTWSLDPYRTPNPAIYLCSASTPPGGGIHGMCGYHAATSALKHVFRLTPKD